MGPKHQQLRGLLTDAIVELCRREAFYVEELRIEGTVCLVSDGSSVLIAQITEQIGEKPSEMGSLELPLLDKNQGQNGTGNEDLDKEDGEHKADLGSQSISKQQTWINSASKLTIFPQHKGKYQCSFCPKKYRFKHSLKDHLNKHLGRRPHVCKHCQASFTHLGSLCSHIKKAHTPHLLSEHNCHLCGEHCLDARTLQKHIASKHGDNGKEHSTRTKEDSSKNRDSMDVDESIKEEEEQRGKTDQTQRESSKGDAAQLLIPKQERLDSNDPEPGEIAYQDSKQPLMQFNPMLDPSKAIPVSDDMQSFLGSFQQQGIPVIPTMDQLMRSLPHGAALMPMGPGIPYQSYTSSTAVTNPASPISTSSLPTLGRIASSRNQEFNRTPDGKFQCPYCEKSYNFKHTLKDHINKHTGRRPHVCKHCGDSFAHLASLCAHIKRRHDEQISNDFLCDICQEKFMNYQSLKQHYTWRHKSMKVPLKLPLSSPAHLTSHPSSSTSATSNADTNPARSSTEFSLPGMNPQWDLSTLTSSAPVFPGQAITNSEGININSSPTDASFSANSLINTQDSKTELEEPDLSYLAGLSLPGELVTPDMDDPTSSDTASFKESGTSPASGLPRSIAMYFDEINMQTEQGQYRYKCKMCGNLFKVRNSLYEHLNSHFGKRPHVCPHCGDSFAHHSSLHNHVRNRHTFMSREEKEATFKHQCATCAKKFRFPSELDRHLKTNPEHVASSTSPAPADNTSLSM